MKPSDNPMATHTLQSCVGRFRFGGVVLEISLTKQLAGWGVGGGREA